MGGKKWEDQSSREGLGIRQVILGVPNSAFLTKGELSLKQQERIAAGIESVVSNLSSKDYNVIAKFPDNTEVLERVHASIVDELETQFAHIQGAEFDRRSAMERQNREQFRMAGAVYDKLEDIHYSGVGIADGIDDLNETAIEIRNDVNGIAHGMLALNQTQREQTELLGKISQTLEIYGSNANEMFHRLADLAVEQIRTNAQEQNMNRHEMRRVTGLAVGQIMMGLEQMNGDITRGLDNLREATVAGFDGLRSLTSAGFESLREATMDVRDSVDRVGLATLEVRDEVRRNTNTQLYIAQNSEVIRATQYLNQGRKLLANGHIKDAIERLNIAFSFNKTDFEINMLLGMAHERLKDEKREKRHLDVAGSFSSSRPQKAQQSIAYAKHEKAKGNIDESIAKALIAIKNVPNSYYSELQNVFEGIDIREKILLPLLETSSDDLNILGLCAVELAIRGDAPGARKAVVNILRVLRQVDFDGLIYGKIIMNLQAISPILKHLMDEGGQTVHSIAFLKVAGIFLAANQEIDSARKYIIEVYKNDEKIAAMKKARDYQGIVDYLKSVLGNNILMLKRFCEVPLEIRKLI